MRRSVHHDRSARRGLGALAGAARLAALGVVLVSTTAANAQYTFTRIAAPGASWTSLGDINNVGQIVGTYGTIAPGWSAFVYDRGTFAPLAYPGAAWTTANALNDAGQIVGSYAVSEFGPRGAYLYDRGTYTPLLGPGSGRVTPIDINNRQQIIGWTYDGYNVQSFLSDAGMLTELRYPGASDTRVAGINDAGQIVGTYQADPFGPSSAFIYDGGVFLPLRLPGGELAPGVSAINNRGQVLVGNEVFTYLSDDRPVTVDVAIPDGGVGGVTYFNDVGQFAGSYWNPADFDPIDPHYAGFLLSPAATTTPEPNGAVLLGAGITVVGLVMWRRRRALG